MDVSCLLLEPTVVKGKIIINSLLFSLFAENVEALLHRRDQSVGIELHVYVLTADTVAKGKPKRERKSNRKIRRRKGEHERSFLF